MATTGDRNDSLGDSVRTAAARMAGNARERPMTTAAIVGGAAAIGAGAWLGARALAQRNSGDGKPLNSVMETAITASECAPAGRR